MQAGRGLMSFPCPGQGCLESKESTPQSHLESIHRTKQILLVSDGHLMSILGAILEFIGRHNGRGRERERDQLML